MNTLGTKIRSLPPEKEINWLPIGYQLPKEYRGHEPGYIYSPEEVPRILEKEDFSDSPNFSQNHLILLLQYQDIWNNSEESRVDREAAQQAFDEIENRFPGSTLNQWGVQLPMIPVKDVKEGRSFLSEVDDDDFWVPNPRDYFYNTSDANAQFLDRWAELCKTMRSGASQ